MAPVRILIVNFPPTVRRILVDQFSGQVDFEILGQATGSSAVESAASLDPSAIVLDVDKGLDTLRQLREASTATAIVLFSEQTKPGVDLTIDALLLGASDYVCRPEDVAAVPAAVADKLIPRIRAICSQPLDAKPATTASTTKPSGKRDVGSTTGPRNIRTEIVAVACSTGGPNALAKILPHLPADFPVPIVIAQHMPPMFTRHLAERLFTKSRIQVSEAQGGETLTPAHVWIAPGDHHLLVKRVDGDAKLFTNQGPLENGCRPAADVLLRSVAETFGPNVLALVLTGMGKDGLRGCEQVRSQGGRIWVQDEATSVVWGMPGQVATANLADQVLALDRIGPQLAHVVKSGVDT